jgi:hypothetical protein
MRTFDFEPCWNSGYSNRIPIRSLPIEFEGMSVTLAHKKQITFFFRERSETE